MKNTIRSFGLLRVILNFVFFEASLCFPCAVESPLPCIRTGVNDGVDGVGVLDGNFIDGNNKTTFSVLRSYNLKNSTEQEVRYYVLFAAAAYCGKPLANWTCPPCRRTRPNTIHSIVTTYGNNGAKAFIALDSSAKEIVLAFRGTDFASNALGDVDSVLVKTSLPNVKVHRGFKKIVEGIYGKITGQLEKAIASNPGFKIIVTGHSMGGALASLTLFKIKQNPSFKQVNFKLFTYGQPRIGNRGYADYINRLGIPITRAVNNRDVAVHYVLAGLGFFHHQNEFWIHETGGMETGNYCRTTTYEDPTCSASVPPAQYSVTEHFQYFDTQLGQCSPERGNNLIDMRQLGLPSPVVPLSKRSSAPLTPSMARSSNS